jgi:hypothetical protein
MSQRPGDKREIPDVAEFDFVDALAEIWFQFSFAAYQMAYVRVYSESDAPRTQAPVLRSPMGYLKSSAPCGKCVFTKI